MSSSNPEDLRRQEQLGRAATAVQRAADSAGFAATNASLLRATGNMAIAGQVLDFAMRAKEDADEALRLLLSLGAEIKAEEETAPAADPLDLSRLQSLSSPAAARLLDSLRAAIDAAEALDKERGHVLPEYIPLQPGETRGTGWAETLSEMVERLRLEVEGPRSGRGE